MNIVPISTAAALGAALVFAALPSSGAESASATLKDAQGATVGEVTLSDSPHGVLMVGELQGLEPGVHGFHIHETGKCEPDFDAAGAHFAPQGNEHGYFAEGGYHAGDLPNVIAAADGTTRLEVFAPTVTLRKGESNSLFDDDGSAIVVHAAPDDYASQPSGAAGDRIACGVIQNGSGG